MKNPAKLGRRQAKIFRGHVLCRLFSQIITKSQLRWRFGGKAAWSDE